MFTICIQPTLVHNRLWIWATRNWELTKHDRDIMWIYKQHYCMTNMISKGVSRNRLHSAKITSVNEKNDDHLIIIGNMIWNNDFHSQFKNLMISWNIAFKKIRENHFFRVDFKKWDPVFYPIWDGLGIADFIPIGFTPCCGKPLPAGGDGNMTQKSKVYPVGNWTLHLMTSGKMIYGFSSLYFHAGLSSYVESVMVC